MHHEITASQTYGTSKTADVVGTAYLVRTEGDIRLGPVLRRPDGKILIPSSGLTTLLGPIVITFLKKQQTTSASVSSIISVSNLEVNVVVGLASVLDFSATIQMYGRPSEVCDLIFDPLENEKHEYPTGMVLQ